MSLTEILGLMLAAAAGGAINAVAGGGTLVTFPALLFFGTPPIIANATSTLALVIGTSGGIYGYRRHLGPVRPWLWRFVPVSMVGGLIGAVLLTWTGNKTFSRLVPFLILFATVLFLSQGAFRRFASLNGAAAPDRRHHAVWGAILFQLAVAIYGGYFGAGIGILMLASLGFIGLSDIHEMNTLKTILASLINLVAAVLVHLQGPDSLAQGRSDDGRRAARLFPGLPLRPADSAAACAADHHPHRLHHLRGDLLRGIPPLKLPPGRMARATL